MNIFILDLNPTKNAEYHCDKHVVKMILETAQLLCSAHTIETPYRKTHINHPCSKWVRASISNFLWLIDLGLELCKEYTHRYGKTHKSLEVIRWCQLNVPNLPELGLTRFAQAMPEEFQSEDAVAAYQAYYRSKLSNGLQMNYTKRDTPEFLNEVKTLKWGNIESYIAPLKRQI